jgi:Na+-transporting NADH:ubiquinone oxidoreductase subunit F
MVLQVMLPVAVFTSVVVVLTALVLFARHRLEPSGVVSLNVNALRTLSIRAGNNMLWALAEHGIFLPAACGGRGSCGQCRIKVTAGVGLLLPTEELHIGTADAAAGVRLACMLKIRESMAIEVPEDVLEAQQLSAAVVSNRSVATYLKELVLRPESPIAFEAGDYLLVEAPAHKISFSDIAIDERFSSQWRENGFFGMQSTVREPVTRAYSIGSPPQQRDSVTLIVRIALPPPTAPSGTPPGMVSSYIFSLQPGDKVTVRGPYGEFHAQDTDREMVFIGGGAGIAPLRSIILDQLALGSRRKMSFWYGARDLGDLCYAAEFDAAAEANENFDYRVALSNPASGSDWSGYTGFIHAVVNEQYLRHHPAPREIEYYLCGPPLMSAAVLHMLEQIGVPRENVFFDDFGA